MILSPKYFIQGQTRKISLNILEERILYGELVVQVMEKVRSQTGGNESTHVSCGRKLQSTLGWRHKGRKWGSQSKGWDPWVEARAVARVLRGARAKEEIRPLLEVSPEALGEIHWIFFSCFSISCN